MELRNWFFNTEVRSSKRFRIFCLSVISLERSLRRKRAISAERANLLFGNLKRRETGNRLASRHLHKNSKSSRTLTSFTVVVFRRGFRISNLFNYKDRFPITCKSMVVYYICCRKCGPSQAYIGKTINSVYERFYASGTGHVNPTNIGSSLLNHINESGDPDCSFHFEDIKILESVRYDQEIRFILLKYDKQNLDTCERSIQLEIV